MTGETYDITESYHNLINYENSNDKIQNNVNLKENNHNLQII